MDNWLENQVTCTESLCWLVLILVNQPLARPNESRLVCFSSYACSCDAMSAVWSQ